MTSKTITTFLSLFLVTAVFGQSVNEDSVYREKRKRLIAERDSLKKELYHLKCSDFMPSENPKWANKHLSPKTYDQNCMWSSTVVVINNDSTFLYKHNGEGPDNYLEKGRWSIEKDSALVLRGSKKLTLDFINEMKSFDDDRYKPSLSTKYFKMTQGMLVVKDAY